MSPITADLLAPLQRRLDALGGDDLLVFQRVGPQRWAHLGGLGRGRGWAGIVEVDDAPSVDERSVLAVDQPSARRVIGPYQAKRAVLVRPTFDRLVVAGSRGSSLELDGDWLALADEAAVLVGDVSPAKRLADELEVLAAVQEVGSADTGTLAAAMAHVATVAGSALSCEVAVVHLPGCGTHVIAPAGVEHAGAAAAMLLTEGWSEIRCAQEGDELPLPYGVEGIRSWLLVPFAQPVGGGILVAHTDAAPRGFTDLCRQLGDRLGDAAEVVLATALGRERVEAEAAHARVRAERDQLTGLGNRAYWERLVDETRDAIAAGETFGVLVLDMDRLKDVNDAYGHDAGDTMIRAFASLLLEVCPGDEVVRLGGDEFGILVRGPRADLAVAERQRVVEAALAGSTGPLALRASIGHCSTSPGEDIRACVRRADQQMYVAKSRSRRRRSTDHPDGEMARALSCVLTGGDDDGAITVALQPLVALGPDERVVAVEALARWTHPVLGPVPPAVFVPAAEQLGLVAALDELVLRSAAAAVVELRRDQPDLGLSVNVSARGLRAGDHLASLVADVLASTGLPSSALLLELTDEPFGCPLTDVADALQRVRDLGVAIGLDDLGTGASSLERVACLPLTHLKIDRAAVCTAGSTPQARRLLVAMINMFHELGLVVCLEGVESDEEVAVARASGADLAQGYAFGVPALVLVAA